jgi:hypothetical protein
MGNTRFLILNAGYFFVRVCLVVFEVSHPFGPVLRLGAAGPANRIIIKAKNYSKVKGYRLIRPTRPSALCRNPDSPVPVT